HRGQGGGRDEQGGARERWNEMTDARRTLSIALGLLTCAALAAAATVKVDFDSHADFTKYKTWSFRPGTAAPNPAAEKTRRAAIEKQLGAHGPKRVDSGGALALVYHAAGENRIDTEKLGYKQPGFEREATKVRYVRAGSVLIDLIDVKGDAVVWRGQAEDVADPTYTDVTRKIDAAMDKLFEHFPPGKP